MADEKKSGLGGHFLKLAGKTIYGVGIASDRREEGMCWKCGKRPPATGLAGKAGTCKPCGAALLGLAIDIADQLDEDDG